MKFILMLGLVVVIVEELEQKGKKEGNMYGT